MGKSGIYFPEMEQSNADPEDFDSDPILEAYVAAFAPGVGESSNSLGRGQHAGGALHRLEDHRGDGRGIVQSSSTVESAIPRAV
jgi:hypothetical protein